MYSVLLNCWGLVCTLLSLVPRPYLADLWWRCIRRIHIIKDICFAREGASLRELANKQLPGGLIPGRHKEVLALLLYFFSLFPIYMYIYIIIYIYSCT